MSNTNGHAGEDPNLENTPTTAQPVETIGDANEPPANLGTSYVSDPPAPTHDQTTRKLIALLILGMLGLFYTGILVAFLCGSLDKDGLHAAISSISGVQALAAAAVGFYYGSNEK